MRWFAALRPTLTGDRIVFPHTMVFILQTVRFSLDFVTVPFDLGQMTELLFHNHAL